MGSDHYRKNFKEWHSLKEGLDGSAERLFYNEREIWWCALGVNVGFEQDGKGKDFLRPVLVLKGFSTITLVVIPITTKQKTGKYYHAMDLGDGIPRQAILSQIRLIDAKRLNNKMGVLDQSQFKNIKEAVIQLLR